MRIIIVDGPDNTGKSLFISNLINYIETVLGKTAVTIHFGKPTKEMPLQVWYYGWMMNLTDFSVRHIYYDKDFYMSNTGHIDKDEVDFVIVDRFMYSEYVYGPIYRNANKIQTMQYITAIEDIAKFDGYVAFVLLTSSHPKLLMKMEDGESQSEGKLQNIENEIKSFDEIFNSSIIDYSYKIDVSQDDETFKNQTHILDEVILNLQKQGFFDEYEYEFEPDELSNSTASV